MIPTINYNVSLLSKRLRLVPVLKSHAEAMFTVLADEKLYEFTGGTPPQSIDAIENWFSALESRKSENGDELWLTWLLFAKQSNTTIGYVQATVKDSSTDIAWLVGSHVDELKTLVHAISHRVARFLEKRGFLECDAENSYLALEPDDDDAMVQLQGHSITYRIAVGPQQGRKVFTLQTLPPDEDNPHSDRVAKEARFSFGTSLCLTRRAAKLCKSALLLICRCTPGYPPRHINVTNWKGCAGKSATRWCLGHAWR